MSEGIVDTRPKTYFDNLPKCGCGRPERYTVRQFDGYVGACNKYFRCDEAPKEKPDDQ